MVNVSNNGIISVVRGDCFELPLFLNMGTELVPGRYILKGSDAVYVGVIEANQTFENAIIKKKYTKDNLNEYGDVKVSFHHEDTENLLPGKYFYEIKLKQVTTEGAEGQEEVYCIHTVVPKTLFIIM